MKRMKTKCAWVILLFLLRTLQADAQMPKEANYKALLNMDSIRNSIVIKLDADSLKKSSSDSSEAEFLDSAPANEKNRPKESDKDELDDLVVDTVVIETKNRNSESVKGDNKIEDLSNLLSSSNIFYTIIFFLFGFLTIKVITYILDALAERSTKYRIAFKGSIPIVKILGWVIVIFLIIVVIYQPSMASMLAVSASIGVAIGFASQDILKNIFGGIVILLDRPFVSGDKIEVDKYYGEVVEIGLRSTRIVTPDDSLVSVPNAVMMNSSLSNSNAGEPYCQVVAEIFLPLTIDTIKIREIAIQAATVSKYIYLGKPITVLFLNEISNMSTYYKMRVKAYVMDIRDEFRFKSDMTELIIKELVSEGILDGRLVKS